MSQETAGGDSFGLAKRYSILAYGSLGTMFDVALMVLGSLLVGLAIAVLLAGFELVDVIQPLSTGAMLASALILAIFGLFCLGVAAEGPLGRGRRLVGFEPWEVGVGRALAAFLIGLGAVLLAGLLAGVVTELPEPLHKGVEGVRSVGLAGMVAMPLIGVPLATAARYARGVPEWLGRAETPIMFVVWAIATMIVFV